MYSNIEIIYLILGVLVFLVGGFIIPAGIHMILFIISFKRKGYYESKKWKYTRVRKDNAWPYEWLYRYAIWSKRYNKIIFQQNKRTIARVSRIC